MPQRPTAWMWQTPKVNAHLTPKAGLQHILSADHTCVPCSCAPLLLLEHVSVLPFVSKAVICPDQFSLTPPLNAGFLPAAWLWLHPSPRSSHTFTMTHSRSQHQPNCSNRFRPWKTSSAGWRSSCNFLNLSFITCQMRIMGTFPIIFMKALWALYQKTLNNWVTPC